jgi:putative nucleotidyltransferase with HDIG domain
MPIQTQPSLHSQATLPQITREQRLQVIVRKGLPPFRQTALELTKVLGGDSPDLKKAGKLISTDPTLSSQVLRMCNSPLLGLHSRVISIDHAATLLGPERLRNLALTSSVADFACKILPASQIDTFWEHSFLTAMLSQHLAERWQYFEKYQAYIAGLLHDIGQIPEWMLLTEDLGTGEAPPSNWMDTPSVEQDFFGTDHCKLGENMARSWGLMPSFLDVLENHHTPDLAQRDSVLVRIIATADSFLDTNNEAAGAAESDNALRLEQQRERFAQLGQGLFGEEKWPQVASALEKEYARVLPIAKAGINGLMGRGTSESTTEANPAQAEPTSSMQQPQTKGPSKATQKSMSVQARTSQKQATLFARMKNALKSIFS